MKRITEWDIRCVAEWLGCVVVGSWSVKELGQRNKLFYSPNKGVSWGRNLSMTKSVVLPSPRHSIPPLSSLSFNFTWGVKSQMVCLGCGSGQLPPLRIVNLAQLKDIERPQELCPPAGNDEHEPANIRQDPDKPWCMNCVTM